MDRLKTLFSDELDYQLDSPPRHKRRSSSKAGKTLCSLSQLKLTHTSKSWSETNFQSRVRVPDFVPTTVSSVYTSLPGGAAKARDTGDLVGCLGHEDPL